jgi:class 3 adenylate cyclase
MAQERIKRRLAAVLAADVVGYSRLMEQNETATLATLKARRKEVLEPLVSRHHGRGCHGHTPLKTEANQHVWPLGWEALFRELRLRNRDQ